MTGGIPISKTAALSIATTTGDDGNVTPPFAIRSSEEAFRHVCNSAYIQSLGGPARGPIAGISGLGHQRKRIGSTFRRGDYKRGALQMPAYQYSSKPAIEPLKKPISAWLSCAVSLLAPPLLIAVVRLETVGSNMRLEWMPWMSITSPTSKGKIFEVAAPASHSRARTCLSTVAAERRRRWWKESSGA